MSIHRLEQAATVPSLNVKDRIRVLLRSIKQFDAWYYRLLTEEAARRSEWHGARVVVPTGQKNVPFLCIFSPLAHQDDAGLIQRTHRIFDHHALASYMRKENYDFVRLARDKTNFIDIGAAEGYYSALFASIARDKAQIISIDPIEPSWTASGHLASVIETNGNAFKVKYWKLIQAYLTDVPGNVDPAMDLPPGCQIKTLTQICNENNFAPDLVKLDIESWEWEVLTGSLEIFQKYRPAIMLELHNEKLRARGLNPKILLSKLMTEAGYQVVSADRKDYFRGATTHLALRHKNEA